MKNKLNICKTCLCNTCGNTSCREFICSTCDLKSAATDCIGWYKEGEGVGKKQSSKRVHKRFLQEQQAR